jgi:protocatechuate 3,4-dioxygenase beta subunit
MMGVAAASPPDLDRGLILPSRKSLDDMGTRNVLVTVFLVLAAGGGLAWFLTRGEASDASRGGVATAGPRGAVEAARPDVDLRGTEVVDPGAAGAPTERLEVQLDPRAGTAVTAADDPAPAISGRVVDPYGRPIEGARVLAADRDGFPLDFLADGEVPPFVKNVAATTDADGRFELAGLAPPSLRILVRAAGYAPYEEERIPLPDVASYQLDDVVLDPGAILEGVVVDPFGRGVPGAELYLEEVGRFRFRGFLGGVGERPTAIADQDGRFRIDELVLGAWRVRVESEEHPDRTFEGLAERAGQILTRTFELEAGDRVTGRVTDAPESERDALLVRATPAGDRSPFSFGAGAREGRVGADGAFAIRGLRADADYDLQVRVRDRGPGFFGLGSRTRSERHAARAGQAGVEIPYRPEAAVLLQVVDARTDQPIEEFHVESGFRWKEPLLGEDRRPIDQHPEGRARIGNLRPDESPAALEIEITAVGYRAWERDDVQVVSGRETDLGLVRLEPLPMVRVTVIDRATGAPVPGAYVTLEEQQDDGGRFPRGFRERRVSVRVDDATGTPVAVGEAGRSALTDDDGLALLNILEGKTAVLRVRRDGYAPESIRDLELPAGQPVDRTVELGRGGAVVARVVDPSGAPLAGVRVDHRAPEDADGFELPFLGGRRGDPVSDSAGEVRFENLAVGEHRFRIERPGDGGLGGGFVIRMEGQDAEEPGWETVEVAEGAVAEVTLVREELGRLTGRITEVGVELAGASVRIAPAADGSSDGFDFARAFGGESERTDSSGRYALENLEPGDHVLTVTHPKRRMAMEYDVRIEPGDNRFDTDLPVSVLEGRVTDASGKPLSGVEVTARTTSRGDGGRRSGRMVFRSIAVNSESGGSITIGDELGEATRTDADGYYSLRGVTPDQDLVVRAVGEGAQPAESEPVRVAPNEVKKGVDLELEPAGAVRVEAFAADGAPAELAMVRATYLDEVPEGSTADGADPKTEILQGASVRLTGMRPGRWSVSVEPLGPSGGGDGAAPQEVEVEVGVEPKLSFHLP